MSYQAYKVYDPEVRMATKPLEKINFVLADSDEMIAFLKLSNSDILDNLVEVIISLYRGDIGDYQYPAENLDTKALEGKYSSLAEYPTLFHTSIQHVCNHLGLPAEFTMNNEAEFEVKTVQSIGSVSVPRYRRIEAMIQVLGRNDGISLYKELVAYRAALPNENKSLRTIEDIREGMINGWSKHKVLDFAIHNYDENMFVAKFDNCIWYDALKDLGDKEIGYLAQCYPGPFMMKKNHEHLRQRRSVTLFSHAFCDELYWDSSVHPDPEQPSLGFLENLKIS